MSKKEGRYYVEYLGWKESGGLYGREFTEPVIKELLARRRNADLPKMTIKVNNSELQISQESTKKSGGKGERTKYPGIPTKDATFVIQGLYPDTDVVACIFLGYNPYTKCAVHVHVYRFDSETTAAMFVTHLSNIIDKPEFKARILGIEKDLSEIGHITLRQQRDGTARLSRHSSEGSDGFSYGTHSPHSADSMSPNYPTADEALKKRPDIKIQKTAKAVEPDKKTKKMFTNVHEELEYKMRLDDAPILLPPKDYDTIVRRHGNLGLRGEVLGPNGIFSQMEAVPYNGQILELSSDEGQTPESDGTDVANGLHADRNKNGSAQGVVRSHSDTSANLVTFTQLRRQHSQASSDKSNNSDEFITDGLYKGYRPRKHRRSHSKEGTRVQEEIPNMAMWSPSYSFGQTGVRNLPTHHEEDADMLNRTAPAAMINRDQLQVPAKDYYTITRTGERGEREQTHHHHHHLHHVKRSHSHKQKGEHGKHFFR